MEISDVGPFHFTRPIVFEVERFENSIMLSNKEADLFASGRTLDEVKTDLQSEIEIAWEEYAWRRTPRWTALLASTRDGCSLT